MRADGAVIYVIERQRADALMKQKWLQKAL